MSSEEAAWIVLYSGGKDSSWALHRSLERGWPIETLLAIEAPESYLFHVPGIALTELTAKSYHLDLESVSLPDPPDDAPRDSTAAGDRELAHLSEAIRAIREEADRPIAGIVSGAVASSFQRDRLERLCSEQGLEHEAPLWHTDPTAALEQMVEAGFDIRIVAVAAEGLDQRWLGRQLTTETIAELSTLQDNHGVHPMGEGGEFETIVLDAPHMDRPLRFEASKEWDGMRGTLLIERAWLAEPHAGDDEPVVIG